MIKVIDQIKQNYNNKMVLCLNDKSVIEVAVFLYHGTEKDGIHICMPSQVGCPIGCKFCATTNSTMPYIRNLTSAELLEIIDYINKELYYGREVDVVSFSGHGEPLLNYDNIYESLVAYRKTINTTFITTVGIKKTFHTIMHQDIVPAQFFLSVHGATEKKRKLIIPDNPSIATLSDIKEFAHYLISCNQRVTFNYMLTKNNATIESAVELSDYLSDFSSAMIRFTPVFPVGIKIDVPTPSERESFFNAFSTMIDNKRISWRYSIPVGSEIGIACGQMRANKLGE